MCSPVAPRNFPPPMVGGEAGNPSNLLVQMGLPRSIVDAGNPENFVPAPLPTIPPPLPIAAGGSGFGLGGSGIWGGGGAHPENWFPYDVPGIPLPKFVV